MNTARNNNPRGAAKKAGQEARGTGAGMRRYKTWLKSPEVDSVRRDAGRLDCRWLPRPPVVRPNVFLGILQAGDRACVPQDVHR